MQPDTYFEHLTATKRQWESSSFLLQNQIRDLQEIESQSKGKWRKVLGEHIDFLAHFNNEAYEYIDASMRYHLLQRHTNQLLEAQVVALATSDHDSYITLINKFREKCPK